MTEENTLLLRQKRYNTPLVTANMGLSLRARVVTNMLEMCLAYTGTRPNTGMVLVEVAPKISK